MCDDDIHVGRIVDPAVSRRAFGVLAAAAAASAAVGAQASNIVVTDVEVKTADGSADSVLAYPGDKGPWPAVLIWTDIVGLRPVFREMAARLAGEGYVVLTPNPYYRTRQAPVVDAGFDFAKPADREKIMGLRASLTPQRTASDSAAFLTYLDGLPQVDTRRRAGVQGYCMGGALAIRTAAAVPGRIGACASFHGAGLVTDAPDSPHLLIHKSKADFLVAVARNDDEKAPSEKDKVKAAFDADGLKAKVEVYPADHGWCVKGSQVYDDVQAERAWSELLALYKRALA